MGRGLSGYLDSLMDNKMENYLTELFPINIDYLAKYPDFLSFGLIILVAVMLSIGVKESSYLNIIFTAVNLITIAIMIIAGGINGKYYFIKTTKN